MSELIEQFLESLRYEKGVSEHTIQSYASDLEQFASIMNITTVDSKEMEKYSSYLLDRYTNHSTRRRKMSSLAQFSRFLYKEGYVDREFTQSMHRAKSGKRLPKVFSSSILTQLIDIKGKDTLSLRNRAILEVLFSSGLRVSELINLTLLSVSTDDTFITVTGKGSKERLVPLGMEARKSIDFYLNGARPNLSRLLTKNWLFLTKNGNKLSRQSVFRIIKNRLKECGINSGSPHTFRHSFATELLKGGADLREVQVLLGHESINTTQVYTHMNKKDLKVKYDLFHPRG